MRLSRDNRIFMLFGAVQSVILAAVAFFVPHSWESGKAYDWVMGLSPWGATGWGVFWIVQAVIAVGLLLAAKNRRAVPPFWAVGWSAWYTVVQLLFALSIFRLTWNGYPGAIAGSIQWAGLALVSWLMLGSKDAS